MSELLARMAGGASGRVTDALTALAVLGPVSAGIWYVSGVLVNILAGRLIVTVPRWGTLWRKR